MLFIFRALCATIFLPLGNAMPLRGLDPIEFGMRLGSRLSLVSSVCHGCAIGKPVGFSASDVYLDFWPGARLPSFNLSSVCPPTCLRGTCTSSALPVPCVCEISSRELSLSDPQIVAGLCFWSERCLGLCNAQTDFHLPFTPSMKTWDSEFP